MYDDIAIFIELVECGSFSKASEKLNLSQATISKKLAKLESTVCKLLITRDTRNMNLTEEGELLYHKFKNLRSDFNDYLAQVNTNSANRPDLHTKLTICLHSTISYELICPYIQSYSKRFPHVRLNIVFYAVDLINDMDFDVGISNRIIDNKKYVIKPIRNDKIKLFCTPRYVLHNGLPRTLEELQTHKVIGGLNNKNSTLDEISSCIFVNKYTGEKTYFDSKEYLIKTNSASHAKKIGVAADYIFWCWESLCEQDVGRGKIIPVLPELEIATEYTFYLVYKQNLSHEGQMFCEFIYKCMEKGLSINEIDGFDQKST